MLHLIQDIATPHNNVVIQALVHAKQPLTLWYSTDGKQKYGWQEDLTNAVLPAKMYGTRFVSFKLFAQALKNIFSRQHTYLLVGWMNPTTRALVLLFWLTRRPYNMWFDMPNDALTRHPLKKALRTFFYFILRTSNAHVFCVGNTTVKYFKDKNFTPQRLTNLPIFVACPTQKEITTLKKDGQILCQKYNIPHKNFLIVAGSRLVHEKGFDLLITALTHLPTHKNINCVIIDQGEETKNLSAQITTHKLEKVVQIIPWLSFHDFQALIAASNVFNHPARQDAFGATIFAHALGVPVLGSTGAGAATDRISHGHNGFLYPATDTQALAHHIQTLKNNLELQTELSQNAYLSAQNWTPDQAPIILQKHLLS